MDSNQTSDMQRILNDSTKLANDKVVLLHYILLDIEEDRFQGNKGCSIEALDSYLENILNEV